jgi:hypothetical protein
MATFGRMPTGQRSKIGTVAESLAGSGATDRPPPAGLSPLETDGGQRRFRPIQLVPEAAQRGARAAVLPSSP